MCGVDAMLCLIKEYMDLLWLSVVCRDVVRCGVVWCGVVRCGVKCTDVL